MRRFTRLTNAFSRKLENHMVAVALYFMWYNFSRIHQTLACNPGDGSWRDGPCVWSVEEIVALLK